MFPAIEPVEQVLTLNIEDVVIDDFRLERAVAGGPFDDVYIYPQQIGDLSRRKMLLDQQFGGRFTRWVWQMKPHSQCRRPRSVRYPTDAR